MARADEWALLAAGYGGSFAAASLVSPHTCFMNVFLMSVFWVLMDVKFGSFALSSNLLNKQIFYFVLTCSYPTEELRLYPYKHKIVSSTRSLSNS